MEQPCVLSPYSTSASIVVCQELYLMSRWLIVSESWYDDIRLWQVSIMLSIRCGIYSEVD